MNILIVDDNEDNRMTIELLLEDIKSISISNAVDGDDAVEQCHQKKFDLIFMDIMMPNMDGIQATKEIKKFAKDTMIIALSALDDDATKQAILHNGAEDYITKPIESELFVQRFKNYMKIISMRNEGTSNTDSIMLFKEDVYPTTLTFKIDSENNLAYFWGYYLNNLCDKPSGISDVIRIIYGFGLWVLKNSKEFRIVSEENAKELFITVLDINVISERIIKNILLKHCKDIVYIVEEQTICFRLNKHTTSNDSIINEEDTNAVDESEQYKKDILSKTHFNKKTAAEFVEYSAITFMDKIDTLDSIEDLIDRRLTDFEKEPNLKNISLVADSIFQYVAVIELLVEFEHLAFALSTLGKFLQTVDESLFEASNVKKFVTLNIYMLNDLRDWRENIFIKQEANDIHYLDSSLLSSCLQLESIFSTQKTEEEDDDLEFF